MLSNKQLKSIEEFRNNIRELHSQGLTDSEIGRILNRPCQTVNNHRHKMGLPTHWIKRVYDNDVDRRKGYILRNTKSRARISNIPFDIDIQDLGDLPEYCPIFPNVKLTYRGESDGNSDCHASVDRIDSTKGYVKGNIHIVSKLANTMKSSASLAQLEEFCANMLLFIENHRARGGITDSKSLDL